MKPSTLQILVFVCLAIATWCRANSFEIDIIGDGKLIRDASWEPWASFWYIVAVILQIITIGAWIGRDEVKKAITEWNP